MPNHLDDGFPDIAQPHPILTWLAGWIYISFNSPSRHGFERVFDLGHYHIEGLPFRYNHAYSVVMCYGTFCYRFLVGVTAFATLSDLLSGHTECTPVYLYEWLELLILSFLLYGSEYYQYGGY